MSFFTKFKATLRGTFFSGVKGGFGMEECCHLLVVEKVTSLSSKRTGGTGRRDISVRFGPLANPHQKN